MTTENENKTVTTAMVSDEIHADDILLTRAEYLVIFEIVKAKGSFKTDNKKDMYGYEAWLHDSSKKYPQETLLYLPDVLTEGLYSISSSVYVGEGMRGDKNVTGSLLFSKSFSAIDEKNIVRSKIGLATRKGVSMPAKDAMIVDYPVLVELADFEEVDMSGSAMLRYEAYFHDPSKRYPTGIKLYKKEKDKLPTGYYSFASEVYLNKLKKLDFRPIFAPMDESGVTVNRTGVATPKTARAA